MKAVSLSLLEKAIFILRPNSCPNGLRKKYVNKACAYGDTSNGSLGSIPASADAVIFRTVLPQASRNVISSCSNFAHNSGVLSKLT